MKVGKSIKAKGAKSLKRKHDKGALADIHFNGARASRKEGQKEILEYLIDKLNIEKPYSNLIRKDYSDALYFLRLGIDAFAFDNKAKGAIDGNRNALEWAIFQMGRKVGILPQDDARAAFLLQKKAVQREMLKDFLGFLKSHPRFLFLSPEKIIEKYNKKK